MMIAARRWPSLKVDADALGRNLLHLGVDDAAIISHGPDLTISFACVVGSPVALKHIEDELHRHGAVARRRFGLDRDGIAEVLQIVRAKLLSGPLPKIGSYVGRGPLEAWIRMIVVRAAFDHMRRPRVANEDVSFGELASEMLPIDVAVDASRQLPRLRECLESALRALTAEERVLLKLHYLEGVSLDRLAALMRVHRATVVRQVATLRRKILVDVGRQLGMRFGTHPSELRSLWRAFGQEVHVTLSRLLS